MKVLVLGGYGNFGTRICKALARDRSIELVVAGRDGKQAASLAQALACASAVVDASDPQLANRLRALGVQAVMHTAGPFQGQNFGVAQAAAQAGCHYIDLADGRRFVCDFAMRLNDMFRQAECCAVTGASTVPALSSAVIDALLPRFSRLDAIDVCIAPAQRAPRGAATVAGVLSYCGVPVSVWQAGQWQSLPGWADPQPVRFARLKSRAGALCDIPDLELFPARYPGVQDVFFRAALEVPATQHAFALLAALRQRGWLSDAPWLAAWLHQSGKLLDWLGTPDGGMVVRMRGLGLDAAPLQWAWHLKAPDHHGPEIPCMAAILLVRRLARGEQIVPGARACMGIVSLHEFQPEFERWGMLTDLVEEGPHGA